MFWCKKMNRWCSVWSCNREQCEFSQTCYNCELELYKLIKEGASHGFPYVTEFGWQNEHQFFIWVDYLCIKEFIDKLVEIFGDGIFEDCHFHAAMQSHSICIDLTDLLDGFIEIEDVFPKEEYNHSGWRMIE